MWLADSGILVGTQVFEGVNFDILFFEGYWIWYFEILKLSDFEVRKTSLFTCPTLSHHHLSIENLLCVYHIWGMVIASAIMEHISYFTIWGLKFLNFKMGLFLYFKVL